MTGKDILVEGRDLGLGVVREVGVVWDQQERKRTREEGGAKGFNSLRANEPGSG